MRLFVNGRRKRAVRLAWQARFALGGLWLIGWPALALDPAASIGQYAHSVWPRGSAGLQAGVRTLAQTGDGNLWVGTESGMMRFDGLSFRAWRPSDQPTPSDPILALASTGERSLWIATRDGVSHWDGAALRTYKAPPGPPGQSVVAIQADRSGKIWVGLASHTSGALCRMEAAGMTCVRAGLPGHSALSIYQDANGSLWVGHQGLCKWDAGCRETYPLPGGGEIGAIAQDGQGNMWTGGAGLRKLSDGRLVAYRLGGTEDNVPVKALLRDRDGGLWIGTLGQGLWRMYQGRVDHFTQHDGLSSDNVRSLLEDTEGNIWVGTRAGLDRFREYTVRTISQGKGEPQNAVGSVYPSRDGGVWMGTRGGLLYLREGLPVVVYDQHHGLPSSEVMGVFEEQSGRLWAFTKGGLAFMNPGTGRGRFHPLDLPTGEKMSFTAAAEDGDHSLWLSDPDHGLIGLRDARVAEVLPWARFRGKPAWAMAADPKGGGLWLGFGGGGIARYRPGQPTLWYPTPGPQGKANVLDLHLMRDGTLWIATTAGLSCWRQGRVVPLTPFNGMPAAGVRGIVEDEQGALWLETTHGLVRIPPPDVARWSADPTVVVHPKIFDAGDGVRMEQHATGYFRRAARSTDGRVWLAVFEGVAVVNPRRLPLNCHVPPVQIEGVAAGPKAYSVTQGLHLPPLTKELRIDYAALSFVNTEKIQFRYYLEGFDKEWHEATTRQAVYTNLPPGKYRFRVIACNNDGLWNKSGAALDFLIAPAYYQTNLFRAACVMALLTLIWSFHRLRLRALASHMNALFKERLAERNRIARDMHDTLLQTLTGCALQLKGLAKVPTLAPAVKDRLEEICHDAEACSRQAREMVWDLRAPTLEEEDLSATLQRALEKIVGEKPVRCTVTVKGTPHPTPADLQQNLLRIVEEATRNAVRYSRAKEIGMDIAYLEPDLLRVQMRDDGCGFDPEQASRETGHWGLITMRERANKMGAQFKISSAPGRGTEIEILVPCTPA